MDFPRAYLVLLLLVPAFLALQAFLLFRFREHVRRRLPQRAHKRLLYGAAVFGFLYLIYPLAWRFVFGFRAQELFLQVFRSLLAVWVFGSSGLALVILGWDFFRWTQRSLLPAAPVSPDLERRAFLRAGMGLAVAAPFYISGYGVIEGRRLFRLEDYDLALNDLSSGLAGFSIVHLTDIHAGPFMPAEELAEYVEAVNRLKPDLIALTGDFVSSQAEEATPCVATLAGLKARYGIFACLGNHDAYSGAEDELTRLFEANGVRVLRNDAVSLRVGNTVLNILGIDDLRIGGPDLPRALGLAQREPGEVRLLLSHRPEVFPEASRKGVEVVLSGHYHGGQVKLGSGPESLSVARLLTPYAEGLFRLSRRSVPSAAERKDSVLFVGRGVGITGLPIRINCPPQIAHLTLKRV
ncbi:MAG: metallophosphoesterase [Deltaproteobacteria bacterium]|nr:metallophosphoesterase [Deltaproteobacteria bacterium]